MNDVDTIADDATLPALSGTTDLVAAFKSDGGAGKLVDEIERAARAEVNDPATKAGRAAIVSLAYRIARSKTALDAAGKGLTEDARKLQDTVNAQRKIIKNRLDALQDEIRKPVDDWERADAERIAALQVRLDAFGIPAQPRAEDRSIEISDAIARLEAIAVDATWQEFEPKAVIAKATCLDHLNRILPFAIQREDQARELAELRAAAEKRAEADRLAAEKAETENAEREAKEKAEADQRAEAEREAARLASAREAERVAAENAAAAARIEAAEREAMLKKEAEDREAKAKADADAREAALLREIADQKAEAQRAADAERNRIQKQRDDEAAADAKRAADAKHVAGIKAAITAAIKAILAGDAAKKDPASAITSAMFDGKVPHVEVKL